jgi:hypothetical protein
VSAEGFIFDAFISNADVNDCKLEAISVSVTAEVSTPISTKRLQKISIQAWGRSAAMGVSPVRLWA